MSDAGRVDGPPGQRLSELFAAHNVELTRFAIRRVGEARAGDIVAETFLVAWRRLDDVPADNARAWLYATARYVIAHEVRSQRRRDNLADEAERDAGRTGQVGDDPGELVAERIHIRTLLAQLRERDQEVLRLSAWEQLTASEAATVMGCSVATYKVRLHRARRRFSALIAASASEDVELIDRIFTAERTTR